MATNTTSIRTMVCKTSMSSTSQILTTAKQLYSSIQTPGPTTVPWHSVPPNSATMERRLPMECRTPVPIGGLGKSWTSRTGKVLDDELKWLKFGGISWNKDGKSFYYSGYDEPAADAEFQSLNLGQKIYLHRVGTPQSEDTLIHQRRRTPRMGLLP